MKNNEEKLSIEIYKPKSGLPSVEVKFTEETVWLTQNQMANLFESGRVNVTEHIHIFNEKELSEKATRRKFRLVRMEGERQIPVWDKF